MVVVVVVGVSGVQVVVVAVVAVVVAPPSLSPHRGHDFLDARDGVVEGHSPRIMVPATTNTAAPVPLISATGGATVPLISAAGGATGAAAAGVATALSSSGQPLGTMAGEFLEDILR